MAKQQTLDPRNLMTGHDGRLYITVNGQSVIMANVDTFQAQINFSNIDFNPVGDRWTYPVPGNQSGTLTITEAVITDEYTLGPVLEAIRNGEVPTYQFRGVLDRPYDGQKEDITYKTCIPDGSWDVQNLTPGDVLKRALNFRIGEVPTPTNIQQPQLLK